MIKSFNQFVLSEANTKPFVNKSTNKLQHRTYLLGKQAGRQGKKSHENPYHPDRQLSQHLAWSEGHSDGKEPGIKKDVKMIRHKDYKEFDA